MALENYGTSGFTELLPPRAIVGADLAAGTWYMGKEGIWQSAANIALATPFDLRPFRKSQLAVRVGALVGGTAPTAQFGIGHMGALTQPGGAALVPLGQTYGSMTAAGIDLICATGGDGAGISGQAGNQFFTGTISVSPHHPPFCRIVLFNGGTAPATGTTAPAFMALYGIT